MTSMSDFAVFIKQLVKNTQMACYIHLGPMDSYTMRPFNAIGHMIMATCWI